MNNDPFQTRNKQSEPYDCPSLLPRERSVGLKTGWGTKVQQRILPKKGDRIGSLTEGGLQRSAKYPWSTYPSANQSTPVRQLCEAEGNTERDYREHGICDPTQSQEPALFSLARIGTNLIP